MDSSSSANHISPSPAGEGRGGVIDISDLSSPLLAPYSRLTEAQLRNRLEPSQGIFICESPRIIRVALDAGLQPVSLLCERKHIEGDARDIVERLQSMNSKILENSRDLSKTFDSSDSFERCESIPIFTGSPTLLEALTGYRLTRGVLCAMRRPAPLSLEDILAAPSPTLPEGREYIRPASSTGNSDHALHSGRDGEGAVVVVIDGVVDSTNIGAIFRSAAALGIDGVVLTKNSCDPLNRRAVRVSMGSVFLVPWCWWEGTDAELYDALHRHGYRTAAMALTDRSVSLDDPRLKQEPRLALVMGTEGDGLPHSTIEGADYVVRIPMHHSVDSLNVAAASAVAFWELSKSP